MACKEKHENMYNGTHSISIVIYCPPFKNFEDSFDLHSLGGTLNTGIMPDVLVHSRFVRLRASPRPYRDT